MQCWRRSPSLFYYLARRYNSTNVPMVLRPYQEHCLEACTDALSSGSTRIGVSLPTGAGKTTVFISLLSRIVPPPGNEEATKALIIVNTIELARQSAAQVGRLFPDWTVEIEQGAKHQASGLADVTVATYQTLNNEQRALKFDPKTLKAVIVDEAHHAAAPSYRRLLSRFHSDIIIDPEVTESEEQETNGPDAEAVTEPDSSEPLSEVNKGHKIPIIGFSATFGRHDGLALGSVFERIVYHRELSEMMLEEWLCKVQFTAVQADLNLKNVTISKAGDFNPTSLAQVVNTESINKLVVKSWILHASQAKSTLIFCVNIAHVDALTECFRSTGIDARSISGKTPAYLRKSTVQAFKDGEYPVLLNCAILTEGADIPNIDCVMIARPTRSRNLYAQMIGRGMRLSPSTGKVSCQLIDFVDSHNRLGANLAVSPSLFGLDPNKLVDEETKDREYNAAQRYQPLIDVPDPSSVTYTEYGDIFLKKLLPNSQPSRIHSISALAWVDCGKGLYVLEVLKKGQIRIKKDENGRYVVNHNRTGTFGSQTTIFARPKGILVTDNLSSAVKGTETFLERVLLKDSGGRELAALRRSAKWRNEPATDPQRKFVLSKWTEKISPELSKEAKQELLSDMTKGNIAEIITRLRNGSIAQLQKLSLTIAKKREKEAKEHARRLREIVSVGPLPA